MSSSSSAHLPVKGDSSSTKDACRLFRGTVRTRSATRDPNRFPTDWDYPICSITRVGSDHPAPCPLPPAFLAAAALRWFFAQQGQRPTTPTRRRRFCVRVFGGRGRADRAGRRVFSDTGVHGRPHSITRSSSTPDRRAVECTCSGLRWRRGLEC